MTAEVLLVIAALWVAASLAVIAVVLVAGVSSKLRIRKARRRMWQQVRELQR